MSLLRIKDEEFEKFIDKKEENKDLAKVALNRAKAKAITNRNVGIGYVLALAIFVVPPIMQRAQIELSIPLFIAFAIIVWLLLTAAISWALRSTLLRAARKEYEKQLFELKVLTKTRVLS